MSSANSLTFEDNTFDKSLIHIKSNSEPSIELWGAPDLTSYQSETCSSNKILCFLFLIKSSKGVNN